jgi:hypothetical protein
LLAAGYARLNRSILQNQEEPAITGFLVQEIRSFLESMEAPAWAARFTVHDDPPINHPGTAGTSRSRVDLEIERAQHGPRPRFQFEAKRLYNKDSVSEYLGEGGLGCFLSGRYAAGHDDAGMLGYVQAQTARDWVAKIQKRMEGKRRNLLLDEQEDIWQTRADPSFECSYSSLHNRPGKPIRIHHTFLACC